MKKQIFVILLFLTLLFPLVSSVPASDISDTRINTTGDLFSQGINITSFAYNQTIPAINEILNYNYYNSTDFDINDYILESAIVGLVGNFSAWDYDYADLINTPTIPTSVSDLTNDFGYYNSTTIPSYIETESDPIFSAQNSSIWDTINSKISLSTIIGFGYYNSTIFDYNDYYLKSNPFGYYNLTNFDIADYVLSSSLSTVATTGAYSDLTGTPTIPTAVSDLTNDLGYWNNIYATFNKSYADTLYQPIGSYLTSVAYSDLTGNPSDVITAGTSLSWSTDTLNVDDDFVKNTDDTMTGNLTLEGIKFESDSTNHFINDNASCVFIRGDTSTLEIC